MSYLTRYCLTLVLCTFTCVSLASDLGKEKRWAEQMEDAIFDGEVLMLNDGELEFLAIYTPAANEKSTDAVILLHGIGVHPDWGQVISPLRTGLPELGWSTLSLQMPVLANNAGYEQYAPLFKEVPARINAGIKHLKENGAKRVVIVSHSLGAAMGSYYLANHHPGLVAGFVGIGMSGGGKHTGMDNIVLLRSVDVPVLDLYGENDLDSVLGSANARKQSVDNRKTSSSNEKSAQKIVPGADHFFDAQNEVLIDEVNRWLTELK